MSPDVYAELLSIQPYGFHHQEIGNLVKAQFTNWTNSDLRLQPIIWGNLLRRVLPWSAEDDLVQWLFHAIPLTYWRTGYTLPPLFLMSNGLKICSIPEKDRQAISLWTAVNKYLYPYVADIVLQSHADATDSVYHYGPVDEFPEPKDPRLRSLLKVASSPSIQKAYGGIPSIDSLFGSVIRDIGYMAVDSFQLCGDIPSFNLDGDRYAVLKLLYALILSSEFGGDASVRIQDLCLTLVTFLRVLHSTSPHHRFLPEDWCTPTMAANFVRIAFQDDAWASQYEPGHGYISQLSAAAELVHYILRSPPVMNEAFSHFVSRPLLGPIARLRDSYFAWNGALSLILNTFITRLESDVLDPETFQQSMEYMFEPGNLFTVCAVLLVQNKAHSLRRLGLLRRDDPTWPEYLKKLDTFPTHLKVDHFPVNSPRAISEFRAFVEGGCVGVYGMTWIIYRQSDEITMGGAVRKICRRESILVESALAASWYQRGRCEVQR